MIEDNNDYRVDLAKTSTSKFLMAVTRMTAMMIQQKGYLTFGDFLQSLTDNDLKSLLDVVEEQVKADETEEIVDAFENIVLLTIMLTEAEGVSIDNMDNLHQNTSIFTAMLTMEGLRRKGFVEIIYDKLSFGDEFKKEAVVRKTELFDKWIEGEDQ